MGQGFIRDRSRLSCPNCFFGTLGYGTPALGGDCVDGRLWKKTSMTSGVVTSRGNRGRIEWTISRRRCSDVVLAKWESASSMTRHAGRSGAPVKLRRNKKKPGHNHRKTDDIKWFLEKWSIMHRFNSHRNVSGVATTTSTAPHRILIKQSFPCRWLIYRWPSITGLICRWRTRSENLESCLDLSDPDLQGSKKILPE